MAPVRRKRHVSEKIESPERRSGWDQGVSPIPFAGFEAFNTGHSRRPDFEKNKKREGRSLLSSSAMSVAVELVNSQLSPLLLDISAML